MNSFFNDSLFTKRHKTITNNNHHVPGLGNFTYYNAPLSQTRCNNHYHPDIIEIFCMVKGIRNSQILENNSFSSYSYSGNEAFIAFPYEIHGDSEQEQFPCEYYALQVNVSNPSCILGLSPEYSQALCNILLHLPDRHLKIGSTNIHYLRTAFNFFTELTPSTIQMGVQFLTCFLFSLNLMPAVRNVSTQTVSEEIGKALSYLEENIHNPVQIMDLSAISGYSLSHFKLKFKRELGITPAEYINIRKIECAKKMLLETDLNITDLAYSLGFSSSAYFCSVFRKYLKVSPTEYRKQQSKPDADK